MKFNLALIALVHAGDDTRDDDQWYGPASNGTLARSGGRNLSDNGERRYDDLEAIANKYWRKNDWTGDRVDSATKCPKWEKANQSTALTTNAKPTKTAKNASAKNPVTLATVNLSDTHGNGVQKLKH